MGAGSIVVVSTSSAVLHCNEHSTAAAGARAHCLPTCSSSCFWTAMIRYLRTPCYSSAMSLNRFLAT